MRIVATLVLLLIIPGSILFNPARPQTQQSSTAPKDERERHLTNIRQLTKSGENAEAYFSPDGKKLIFQWAPKADGCDQIYSMNIDGSDVKMLSKMLRRHVRKRAKTHSNTDDLDGVLLRGNRCHFVNQIQD